MKRKTKTVCRGSAQLAVACLAAACMVILLPGRCNNPVDSTLYLVSTNDCHGKYLDSSYVDGELQQPSLCAINRYVDSIRNAVGKRNVLLLDGGDCLQGDYASYYYNFVDTVSPHLFARVADYMGYDAVCVGNHDVETGHPVYDRVARDLASRGIPFLAANAVRVSDGKPYFGEYKVFRRAGAKVLVIGYTNANIKAWLDGRLWSGIDFKSLTDVVQDDVDRISARVKPDVVVVLAHTGVGRDDPGLENQGYELYTTLRGVDFVICGHDHASYAAANDSICIMDGNSYCKYFCVGELIMHRKGGKINSREFHTKIVKVDAGRVDSAMSARFNPDYRKVRDYMFREVGELRFPVVTRDAYRGMCYYMNLNHTVALEETGADISLLAPLTYNGVIPAGKVLYRDMFTLYPYENQLFVVKLAGREVREYLEKSYDLWIGTFDGSHVLRISRKDNQRYGGVSWSFVNRPYSFDSAAGLDYTVDVTKPFGSRVKITSMADGTPFDEDRVYDVATSSYRSNVCGWTDGNTVKMREMREILCEWIERNGTVTPEMAGDPGVVGTWRFVPDGTAGKALEKDYKLLFGE